MRVTFEHTQNGNHFILDTTVEFSEEEKAIIRQRALADNTVSFGGAAPAGSGIDAGGISSAGVQFATRLLVVAAFVSILTSAFKITWEPLPLFLFLGAGVLFIFRKMSERKHEASFTEKRVSLGTLISNPRVRSYSTDAPTSKTLEESIRNQLTGLKEAIKESVTIPAKQTYEI